MANLILTQACNKGCAYCFARQIRESAAQNEMSLTTIHSLLDKIVVDTASSGVSLLGGEPTQHSQFTEILDICVSKKVQISLISNFLFSVDIRNKLLSIIQQKHPITFLVNATELRDPVRMKVFAENYNSIYKTLQDTSNGIALGLTLDGETLTQEGFRSYIDFLVANLNGIDRLRLSINFPGDRENKEKLYFIDNYDLGDLLYFAVRYSLAIGAVPLIDCISFPCMYRSDKIRSFIKRYDERHGMYICGGPPTDYLPDGTARYCFPALSISVDATKYKSDAGIRDALRSKYTNIQKTLKLPEVCATCTFHRRKLCAGPCLGFRDLSN